jgi:Tol biopolymer transport system component
MTIALRRPWSAPPLRLFAAGLALLVLLTAAGLLGAALAPKEEDDTVSLLPARSGGVVVESDGDLWTWDPVTDARELLVENGVWPVWAPDGERLFFLRPDGEADLPMVLDRGQATPWGDGSLREVQAISWSPDSEAVAVASMVDGRPQVSMLREGEAVPGHSLPGTILDWPAWDPDSSTASWRILVRSRSSNDPSARASLIRTEGKDGSERTSSGGAYLEAAGVDQSVGALSVLGAEWDLLGATWNPVAALNGVAYTQLHTLGTDAPDGNGFRVHVFDGTTDRALEFDPAADDEAWPAWDPTGGRVAFQSYEGSTGSSRVVIATSGGEWCPDGCLAYVASDPIPVDGPNDLMVTWSPDGTELLVVDQTGSVVRRMDAATGALTELDWSATFADWR